MQVNPISTNYYTPVHVFIAQVNAGANLKQVWGFKTKHLLIILKDNWPCYFKKTKSLTVTTE